MTEYLINENIHGYEKATIDNLEVTKNKENTFIIVISKAYDNNTGDYYKFIDSALKNNNRVILISFDDDNKMFKPLASLMITFSDYDIYQIQQDDVISANFLLKIKDREPDLSEVQTYVGGDVTAYSDISTILFGIESLVDEGNEDKLKGFLEEHLSSIENLTTTLNNMKKTCEVFNSNELVDTVNKYKEKEDKLNKAIADKDKTLDETKYDRDKFKVEAEKLGRENAKLKASNEDLKSNAESGGSVIKTYNELNTQIINCKAKIVLYFKEISYVPYMNSLIDQLYNVLDMKKLKTKLVIYDSQTDLYRTYDPLPVLSGADYIAKKNVTLTKTKKFVVSEPNTTILQDVLTSEQCFDVVIVYDRVKSIKDLVAGNNVTKFFVINSSMDYEKMKQTLKINDTSFIITQAHSSIELKEKGKPREFLDIPYIEGYSRSTAAAKSSKYIKLMTAFKNVPLIDTILTKSRINTLTNS